jgi:hypothetical protein
MRTIRATKTQRYADKKPHLPQIVLIDGITYKEGPVSSFVIESALKLGFAEEITSENLETQTLKLDETIFNPDTEKKEKDKKKLHKKKKDK